jgi:cytohesin
MEQNYLAQIQALIDQKYKDDPEALQNKKDEDLIELVKSFKSKKDLTKIKKAIEEGADPNSLDDDELSLLYIALIQVKSIELAKLLVEGGIEIDNGIIEEVIAHHSGESLKFLIDEGADVKSRNFLHAASNLHAVDIIRVLVEAGVDINKRDSNGMTALHASCESKHISSATETLIELGADVNARDSRGETPMHRARGVKHMMALIEAGADVNARTNGNSTPLHKAASRGDIEVGKLLISNKADINAKNEDGLTPIQVAYALGNAEFIKTIINETGGEMS